MNHPTRLVAAFADTARCRREDGAVQWCIHGTDRDGGAPLELLLSGAGALQLPAEVPGAELHRREAADSSGWELHGNGAPIPLPVRAVQVHRGAAAAFARALPQPPNPWSTRAQWWLLLNLLRIPGVARLLGRFSRPEGDA